MDTTSKYACEGRCVQLLEPKNIIGILYIYSNYIIYIYIL